VVRTFRRHVVRTFRRHAVRTFRRHAVRTFRRHAVRTFRRHVAKTFRPRAGRTFRRHVARTFRPRAGRTFRRHAAKTSRPRARSFRQLGADLAITYLNGRAKSYVKPLADTLDAALFVPLDVSVPGQLEAVFDAVETTWGRLDILVHSIAFAPKEDLQGGLLDC